MSNLFEAVKENVNCLDAGKRYGLEPNRSGFCRCVFHADRKPSLKLYSGTSLDDHSGYHCFSCGATGTVVDLVSGIFGITPKESALMIARDFCVPYDDDRGYQPDPEAVRQQKVMKQAEKALNERITHFRNVTYDYLRELEKIVSEGNLNDPNYYPAICDVETVRYYADQWETGSYLELAEMATVGEEIFKEYETRVRKLTEKHKTEDDKCRFTAR